MKWRVRNNHFKTNLLLLNRSRHAVTSAEWFFKSKTDSTQTSWICSRRYKDSVALTSVSSFDLLIRVWETTEILFSGWITRQRGNTLTPDCASVIFTSATAVCLYFLDDSNNSSGCVSTGILTFLEIRTVPWRVTKLWIKCWNMLFALLITYFLPLSWVECYFWSTMAAL